MRRPIALTTVAILLSAACLAGIRAAGKYTGVVVFDRWGGCVLSAGPTLDYVAEAAKGPLKPLHGTPVVLDVSDAWQPVNPGEALLRKFKRVEGKPEEAGPAAARLQLTVEPAFADGQPAAFTIAARNVGEARLTLKYESLAPIALMKRRDKSSFLLASDGPSVAVLVGYTFWCPIDGQRLESRGGVQAGIPCDWRVTNVKTLPRTAVLEPGGESVITIALSLPPGEYDFFAAYRDLDPSPLYVASNLVGCDVDTGGGATLPKFLGR